MSCCSPGRLAAALVATTCFSSSSSSATSGLVAATTETPDDPAAATITQVRTFGYDGRGFLLQETHPELGTAINYSQYGC